jgi:hypothetical protein
VRDVDDVDLDDLVEDLIYDSILPTASAVVALEGREKSFAKPLRILRKRALDKLDRGCGDLLG